jgi:hypothetical protein
VLRTTEKASEVSRDAELLRYFRHQLEVLSDDKALEIMKTFGSASFTNRQARPLLRTTRQGAWFRLAGLVELGFLEKRGNSYRVSPSAGGLMAAVSTAFRGLLTSKVLLENKVVAEEVVRLARQGVELMYAKGMIQPADVSRHQKMLAELEKGFKAIDE